jgi:hypothetical protein
MGKYTKLGFIVAFSILSFLSLMQSGLSYTRLDWSMYIGNYVDNTPPAAITDLVASIGSDEGQIDLTWTAPGDDGNVGTASAYWVRYNMVEITAANWFSSVLIPHPLTPKPAGSVETLTVSDLTPGETYYFAIRSWDEIPNPSALSNSPGTMARLNFTPLSAAFLPTVLKLNP